MSREVQWGGDPAQPRRLSRRAILRGSFAALGAGVVAALGAACGGGAPAPAQAPAQAPASQPPAASQPAAPTSAAAPAQVSPAAAAAAAPRSNRSAARKGGSLRVAIIGEPPALDPTFTTATVTSNTTWHVFEALFAQDAKFTPKPMLAEGDAITENAKVHTIALRKGVKFHNGQEMTSKDVVASLKRWGELSGRGRDIFKRLDNLEAKDASTVVMSFKEPTGALPFFLMRIDAMIIPADLAESSGKEALKQRIGTGPYKEVEHLPDRYWRLQRFDDYAALPGEPDGYGGNKVAYIDEIRFIPVPEARVRADGVISGEYHFAESLVADNYGSLKDAPGAETYIVKPYYFYGPHFNKKEGLFTDRRLRQAVLRAVSLDPIMQAGFGSRDFWRLDPSISAPETAFFSTEGENVYNKPNPEEAKKLLEEAGYSGQAIRWIATKEYDYNYSMALAFKDQLEKIGMNIDLQVMDWATLVQRRAKPELYEIFLTGHPSYDHPMLQVFLNAGWPGWWENAEKDRIVGQMIAEADVQKHVQLAAQLQKIFWEDVPMIKCGEAFTLRAGSKSLKGYDNPADYFFWNAWLEA